MVGHNYYYSIPLMKYMQYIHMYTSTSTGKSHKGVHDMYLKSIPVLCGL